MRYIKLALLSIFVFYGLIWAISLIFPNVHVVSRAINISGSKENVLAKINSNTISFNQWLTKGNGNEEVLTADTSFYKNNLFNAEKENNVDTLYFEIGRNKETLMQGGIGLYQLTPDSATLQLFYVFRTKWYKPWEKMAQMANDAKYGWQMDSAVNQFKILAEANTNAVQY